MASDSHAGIGGRVSRQQRREDGRRVREARQKAKAIDKENDQKRKDKKGPDKKRKKGK